MDTEGLLRSLNAHSVRYVVIGEDRLGAEPAAFASLADLIRMKEAAGRAKDLEDLRVLREIERRGR